MRKMVIPTRRSEMDIQNDRWGQVVIVVASLSTMTSPDLGVGSLCTARVHQARSFWAMGELGTPQCFVESTSELPSSEVSGV